MGVHTIRRGSARAETAELFSRYTSKARTGDECPPCEPMVDMSYEREGDMSYEREGAGEEKQGTRNTRSRLYAKKKGQKKIMVCRPVKNSKHHTLPVMDNSGTIFGRYALHLYGRLLVGVPLVPGMPYTFRLDQIPQY